MGVIWPNNKDVLELAPVIDRLALVALVFPKFRDGRAYTQARLLRERLGFTGELRATGNVLRDQFLLMVRCGFDALDVAKDSDAAAVEKELHTYSVFYQPPRRRPPHAAARASRRTGFVSGQAVTATRRSLQPGGAARGPAGGCGAAGNPLRCPGAFPRRIAAVSSFGTESAVLLHMLAQVDRATPVLFLDTGHLFTETLAYRDALIERLGLTDVRTYRPDERLRAAQDADNDLWASDTDACCPLRKVEPLSRALAPFSAWINGRKRYQAATRAQIPFVEQDDGRVKFNPLAALGRRRSKAG